MCFPSATDALMDVAAGFTLALPMTPSLPGTPGCPATEQFCPFTTAGLAFAGTARSVVFGGAANQIGYDNVTDGSASTVTTPKPASLALLATGLAGMVGGTRRKGSAATA